MKLPTNKYWRVDFFGVTGVEKTSEGFWKVSGTAAAVGPMTYTDEEGNSHVEYADAAVLANYAPALVGKPVTNGHPSEGKVVPENYKTHVVGTVLEAWFDADLGQLKVVIMVNDADAQRAIDSGRVQLSPAYFVTLGESSPDWDADYLQVARDYNHLAIVDKARGGDSARLHLDSEGHMTTVRNDAADKPAKEDAEEEREDKQREDAEKREDLQKKLDALQAKYDALKAKMDAEEKDKEDGEEKKDGFNSDAAFAAAVADHMRVIDVARRMGIECDPAQPTSVLKRTIVREKMGGTLRNDSQTYVDAAFDALVDLFPEANTVDHLAAGFRGDTAPTVPSDRYGSLDDLIDPTEQLRKGAMTNG
jgi:hypothetical protein